MILGIGTDLVELVAFGHQLHQPGSQFMQLTFTPGELRTVRLRPAQDKTPHLGARFAAKEAFIKAWSGSRFGLAPKLSGVDMRHIEVIEDGFGRPALLIHEPLLSQLPQGLRMHLSMSHDGAYATATVLLEL